MSTWAGFQHSVIDEAIDQWRQDTRCLHFCARSKDVISNSFSDIACRVFHDCIKPQWHFWQPLLTMSTNYTPWINVVPSTTILCFHTAGIRSGGQPYLRILSRWQDIRKVRYVFSYHSSLYLGRCVLYVYMSVCACYYAAFVRNNRIWNAHL